jgi:hypothetical protein
MSKDDLINEFLDGYLTSASFTKKGLLKSSDKIGQYGNPEDTRRNMLVSFLEDVKSQSKLHSDVTYITSARTAAKDKKKWVTAKNTSKLKNVFLLSFRKPNAKDGTKQYYSNTPKDRIEFLTKIKKELTAIKKAFGLTEAQKIKEANKKIFLDKYIISNEDLAYYKANIDPRQASIIDDLMKIFEDEFGINILMRESFNDPALKNRRVHIDGTEGKRVLKVNPYLYTNLEKSEDNKTLNPPKKQADALSKMILDMGYKGFKSVITEKGKFKFTEFLFPKIYQVRLKVGVKRKGLYYNDKYEYVLFKLKKVYSVDPATSVVSETNEVIRGSYAEYEVVLNNGSYAQWPGGFMFGERASNEETRPKPQEKLYGIDGVDIEDSHFDIEGFDAQQGQGSAEENIDDFDDQFDPSGFDPMPLTKEELVGDYDQKTGLLMGRESKPGFTISADKLGKDQGKADLANAFIGHGLQNTSTDTYSKDAKSAGIPTNEELYDTADENTIAFVSVNGGDFFIMMDLNIDKYSEEDQKKILAKRKEKITRLENIQKTLDLVNHVLSQGGTVIMDNSGENFDRHPLAKKLGWGYKGQGKGQAKSRYNTGEKTIQDELGAPTGQTSKGYNYWGKYPESKGAISEIKMNTASVTNEIIGDNKGEEYNKLKDFIESFRPITEASIVKDLINNKWVTKKEYDESAGLVDLLMSKYDEDPMTTMDEFIEALNKCIIIF